MGAVLEVKNTGIRFGGLVALDDVNVNVPEWEIVGLIGPNGAGKTTLFNCIMGAYAPNTGSISFRGRDISLLPTHRRTALGIGRTFQNIGLIRGLSVLENFMVAQHPRIGYGAIGALLGAPRSFAEERKLKANALEVLDFIGLAHLADSQLDGLPYGTLKLIEVGTVLATDPDLLLLDEPSSGMGPDEAHEFGERLLRLRQMLNLTVLMIEHHVPLVVGVCDYVYVLNFGKVLTEGKPQEVRSHPEVIAAYLGGEVEQEEQEEGAGVAS
ncbi:MAG: branched-chain amino acid transport system ATP-binding protein [Actinomycetota bacterium]|jgi:branched-chain amino acid transport system ATP-binding protein|nr:branched-chain amino acid transport system ATP-binding protein [Actinomycetota bacterium]